MNKKIRWIDTNHEYTEWIDIDEAKIPDSVDYVEISELMTIEELMKTKNG